MPRALATTLALLGACSSTNGRSDPPPRADRSVASGAQDAVGQKAVAAKPWIRVADAVFRSEAVGLWRIPPSDRERRVSADVRAYPGTMRFLYDGQTVTLRLFTEKDWMYRSPDDHYRLATRWQDGLLQYRPPFGVWTDLARFRAGRFETPGGDPPWQFEAVASRDACEPDDLPLIAERAAHDYSIKPTAPSPATR